MGGFVQAVGDAAFAAIAVGARAVEEMFHILNGKGS